MGWEKNDWSANYAIRYVGKVSEYEEYGQGTYKNTTLIRGQTVQLVLDADAMLYHSVSVTKAMDDIGLTTTLGVANLYDTDPPRVSSIGGVTREGNSAFYSMYDQLGRRVFLNMSYKF